MYRAIPIDPNYAPRAIKHTTKKISICFQQKACDPAKMHSNLPLRRLLSGRNGSRAPRRRSPSPLIRPGHPSAVRPRMHAPPLGTSGWKTILLCRGLWKDASPVSIWCRRCLLLRRWGVLVLDTSPGVVEWDRESVGRRREPRVLEHFFRHRPVGCLVRHHGLEQVGRLDAQNEGGRT